MIPAKVSEIYTKNDVSYVVFNALSVRLAMLSLENLKLKVGESVLVNAKSSDIFLATQPIKNSSVSNELKCVVDKIKIGEILSTVTLDFNGVILQSIITTNSAKTLNIKNGDEIYPYIKATSLYISEIL